MNPRDRYAHEMNASSYWRSFPVTVTFDQPGDEVVGQVVDLLEARAGNDRAPKLKLLLDDGQLVYLVAWQSQLHAALVARRPVVGDRIKVLYTGETKTPGQGMKPTKQFTVALRRPTDENRPEDRSGSREEAAPENGPQAGPEATP